MGTSARQGLKIQDGSALQGVRGRSTGEVERLVADVGATVPRSGRARVRVVSENDEVQEQLSILAAKGSGIELIQAGSRELFHPEALLRDLPDLLLIKVRGNLDEDISLIRKIRIEANSVHIVLYGCTGDEREFLQYVRAGVRGYLQAGASAEDMLEGLLTVFAGRAFCPGSLCSVLFRYFEREATTLPSAAMRQRLGLTRREQQLLPLIARGLTNKEIANHFCLSEQTVKNHLYRMKHKVGADNRLGIVQTCHTQGFLL